ncbi:MAG: endonuclease MutS2 [Nitrospira sp.]|nr:endonuclease MutS2 [Nitrospira sp.]
MIRTESLKVLEFDKILNVISRFSHSEASQKSVLKILPLHSIEDIEKRFGQIQEIRRLSHEGTPLKLFHFHDISQAIEKVRPIGAILDPRELLSILSVLQIISEVSSQLKEGKDIPLLREFAVTLTGFPEILVMIERTIDSEGNILDSASSLLFNLRTRIRRLEGKIRKRLEETIRDRRIAPFLQDNFITQRSGRWVIPLRMDSKGRIPGVVHDVSRSGETAFIEPLEIIGIANELGNILADEKAEEIRILRSICEKIRVVADEIEAQYKTIVYIDVLHSIARFADQLKMEIPRMNNTSLITLQRARHPLLMLSKKEHGTEEVVPLDLSLGSNNTVMVITGPNAGGKTIAIKTAGLLLVMAMSGIPVPADSSSTFPLVSGLLVDIGDEQSIENNLSTFSAHVANISEILKRTDSKTIVLIDELGTGTDPVQGAAIACAVLHDLKEKGTLVFATTHLIDIVSFVFRTNGMINASMDFDQKTLMPLYRLKVGEPGQSHALEIAKRYGMPDDTIRLAKEMLGSMKEEFHNLITDLKEKRLQHEEALTELQRQRSDLKEKEILLKERLAEAEDQKSDILKHAHEEAKTIILDTKRQINAILEEAKRERSREAKKKIVKTEQQVDEKLKEYSREPSLSIEEVREGDVVFVRSIGYDAEVIHIDREHKHLRVKVGGKEIEVSISDIGYSKGKLPETKIAGYTLHREEEPVPFQLNMVGLRVDEALSRLEPFLNHASLAGLNEVTIIHGVGTGQLLKAVRSYLTEHPLVIQFRSGEISEGGNGVTIVKMK